MQEYLPIIKTMLLEWAQLTLANPAYAAALVAATVLLAMIVGSIKSIPIKRKAAASEKARVELANELAQSQQLAAGLQERLAQRNQQIAGTMQALTTGFELGEQALPAGEDSEADALWQQHDRVLAQLAGRLRSEQQAKAELQQSYQAEIGKRVEKEAVADALQNTLAEKTRQIAGLEQQSAEILEKHAAQSARLAELEQQSLEWQKTRQQVELLEAKLIAKEAEFSQLQIRAEAQKAAELIPPPVQTEPLAEAASIPLPFPAETVAAAELIQPEIRAEAPKAVELVQPPMQAKTEQVIEPTAPAVAVAETIQAQGSSQTIVLPDWEYEPAVAAAPEVKAQPASGSGGVAGKFKNLFGRSKAEPVAAAAPASEAAPVPVEANIQPETAAQAQSSAGFSESQIGKIKSLFGKPKQDAPAKEEVKTVEAPAAVSVSEPADAGEASAETAKKPFGKIKNLFSSAK